MWNPKADEQLVKERKCWSKILKPQLPSSLGTSILGMESAEAPEDGFSELLRLWSQRQQEAWWLPPHRCSASENVPPFPTRHADRMLTFEYTCVCVCVLQSAEETKFYKGTILLICLEWQELQKQLRIRFPFTKPQMDFNLKAQCRKQITIVLLGKRNSEASSAFESK